MKKTALLLLILGFASALFFVVFQPNSVEAPLQEKELSHSAPPLILVGEGGTSGQLFVQAAQTFQASHGGEIRLAHDGDEAIRLIQEFKDQYGFLSHLEYFGHGNSLALFFNQDLGVNGALYVNDPSLNQLYRAASIYDLPSDLFQSNGTVRFNGCNVAENHAHQATFAQDFADYFQVSVVAATGPTEFLIENMGVQMIPTYKDGGFVTLSPSIPGALGFKDVYEGEALADHLTYLYDHNLKLTLEEDDFRPYARVQGHDALAFCRVLGSMDLCFKEFTGDEAPVRNLQVLAGFLKARGIDLPYSDPWFESAMQYGRAHQLLPSDFGSKKWLTREETADLAFRLMRHTEDLQNNS